MVHMTDRVSQITSLSINPSTHVINFSISSARASPGITNNFLPTTVGSKDSSTSIMDTTLSPIIGESTAASFKTLNE